MNREVLHWGIKYKSMHTLYVYQISVEKILYNQMKDKAKIISHIRTSVMLVGSWWVWDKNYINNFKNSIKTAKHLLALLKRYIFCGFHPSRSKHATSQYSGPIQTSLRIRRKHWIETPISKLIFNPFHLAYYDFYSIYHCVTLKANVLYQILFTLFIQYTDSLFYHCVKKVDWKSTLKSEFQSYVLTTSTTS